MGLSSKWFSQLRFKESKGERETTVRASHNTLEALTLILRDEHDALLRKQQSTELFVHAGWPYEQAYLNGRMAQLRAIIEMTDLTED